MDRRTFRVFLAALIGIVVVVAVGSRLAEQRIPNPEAPQGEEAVGIVTSIDSGGLSAVRGFTLRTSDGEELEFRIGALENGTEFPPGHLTEHQSLATLIRVWFREENGERVAFRLEDAE